MQGIICAVLQLYMLALFVRAILSWFPVSSGSGLLPVLRALDTIINPLVVPLRRVIPPMGMLDSSFIVLFFIVLIVHGAVCGGSFI